MEEEHPLVKKQSLFTLDPWQRFYIYVNRDILLNRIRFNDKFKKSLTAKAITCQFYNSHYLGVWMDCFTNLACLCKATGGTYQGIIASLKETDQGDAVKVLKRGCIGQPGHCKINTRIGRLCVKMGNAYPLELLQKEFDPEDKKECWFEKGEKGVTLLHSAVGFGRLDVVQYLISVGLDVNARDKLNRTPLHCLGFSGSNMVGITEELLQHGADIFAVDTNRCTVAHFESWCNFNAEEYHRWVSYIIEKGYGEIFQMKATDEDTPLHGTLEWLNISKDTLSLIFSLENLNINTGGERGDTILLRAAFFGRSTSTLESLIELGADWKITNKCKVSVLHCTVAAGNVEAIQSFISKGADLNARDIWNNTPLHMVAYAVSNHEGLTKMLLENGADVYASNLDGNSVAHLFDWCGIGDIGEQQSWRDFLIQLGHSKLFQEENKYRRLPLSG